MNQDNVKQIHPKPEGEAMNTPVMKLVKGDGELALEARQLIDALVDVMGVMFKRKLVVEIQLDNGLGPYATPTLVQFVVKKTTVEYRNDPPPGQPQR